MNPKLAKLGVPDLVSDDFPICCGDAPVRRIAEGETWNLPTGARPEFLNFVRYECAKCGKELTPTEATND